MCVTRGNIQVQKTGSEVYCWQAGAGAGGSVEGEISFWLGHLSHGHAKSQLFPVNVSVHRTVGHLLVPAAARNSVINSAMSDCQPNPVTHSSRAPE